MRMLRITSKTTLQKFASTGNNGTGAFLQSSELYSEYESTRTTINNAEQDPTLANNGAMAYFLRNAQNGLTTSSKGVGVVMYENTGVNND